MDNVTKKFVNKIYRLSKSDIPEDIIMKSKLCFLDYLASVIGGSKEYINRNISYISENRLSGNSSIVGIKEKTDITTAVFINAFNAHVLELDDSHRQAMTHLGAPVFSALTVVAELYDKSIYELIRSAVTGYEAAIRLANAIQPGHKKRGFHVSGTCCTVGCAMAIADLLDFSEQEMNNVFSAAVTSAAGLLAVISGDSEQKPYNIANAAVSGLNAALYGKYYNGAVDILGDQRGFFHAVTDDFNESKLFEEGYAIETIYQKLYAACRHCHAPMEAMLGIECDYRDIKKIEVKVYDLAIKGHDHTEIKGVSSAKQSIPYGVSVACIHHNCGLSAFKNDIVNDENVLDLASLVSVSEDPELSRLVPGKRAARVIVYLNNGDVLEKRVDYPKGEPENPVTKEELKDKFNELSLSVDLEKEKADSLWSLVDSHSENKVRSIFEYI